ncbi:hypothetical protein SAMN05216226_11032 [Halovenus aranensis]|jgi:hypothetical protein|uniref:PEP-CTERM protein-sorting domain-containing protein n=1 Tax=Halovenus aranensis TaxID=890420 RepID=A0A1G8X1X2_9EURY|nr:hypothetical protein [Halovenus aranensis]SDJ83750.1 hypothetical protein SAMN05216226_11032 [Halovenus aranensis]
MTNPVEANVVTRFILGLGVILAMMVGGGATGQMVGETGIPYGEGAGVAVGALVVFLAFVVVYRRYDASFSE